MLQWVDHAPNLYIVVGSALLNQYARFSLSFFGEKLRAIAHPRKLEASEVIDVEVEATAEDEESLVIETPDMKSRQVKLYASFRVLNFQFCFILTFYSYKS